MKSIEEQADKLIAQCVREEIGHRPTARLCGCDEMWDDRNGMAEYSEILDVWFCSACGGRWW